MKKIIALALSLIMVLSLFAGCGAKEAPAATEAPKAEAPAATESAAEAPAEEKLTLAGVVFKDDFTMKMMQMGFQAAADDYGVELLLGNCMSDLAAEQQLVYSYMDMDVDGIAIMPYSEEASMPVVKEAADAGIKIALANTPLKETDFICGGITSPDRANGEALGRYSADYLIERYGTDLKIAIIDFDATIPEQSMARYGGFLDALTAAGITYEIVAQQSSTSKNDNVPIIEAMLAGAPDCDVFMTTSSAFTSVVVQVVSNMGLADQITVIGYDMSEQTAAQMLEEGSPLYCTLEQDFYTIGYESIELLVQTLRGEETACAPGETLYLEGVIHCREDKEELQTWLDNYYELSGT